MGNLAAKYRHRLIPIAIVFLLHVIVLFILQSHSLSESRPIPPVNEVVVQLLAAPTSSVTPTLAKQAPEQSRPAPKSQPIKQPQKMPEKVAEKAVTETASVPLAPSRPIAKNPSDKNPLATNNKAEVTPDPAPTVSTPVVQTSPAVEPSYQEPRFNAAYLNNPAPAYPAAAKRMQESGKVILRVYVDASGSAAQVEVRQSSGSTRLDNAALEAVRRWRFIAAKRGNEAVAAWVLVPVIFQLDS